MDPKQIVHFDPVKGLMEAMAAEHAETRRHIDIALEGVKRETQLVAEAVAHVDERLTTVDNRLTSLEERVERTATETQAMFKFSQARVERLDSSTH